MVYYIYIITNKTNTTLYVGMTNNLNRRIYEHKNKLVDGFSSKYNLYKLVYIESYNDVKETIAREKQIKKWSRKKKESLIDGYNPQRNELTDF